MRYKNYIPLLVIGSALWLTCSIFEPAVQTSGSIAIHFVTEKQESLAKELQSEEALASIRCVLKREDRTIHDRIYYKAGTFFHIEIRNLEQADNYAVRLYGRNKLGCAIGSAQKDDIRVIPDQVTVVELTWQQNLELGAVTDIDGNVYVTVEIGGQWWMGENLKVTHYRNGESIPQITNSQDWYKMRSGAWCVYDNDLDNTDTYGLLYNWHAVNDIDKLAPEGWHIPTEAEWQRLEMHLGMSPSMLEYWGFRGTDQGDKMKSIGTLEAGTGLWTSDNISATNESCFSVVPSGWRIYNGVYYGINYGATFWSASEYDNRRAWSRTMNSQFSQVLRSYGFKERGFSVRCVKD